MGATTVSPADFSGRKINFANSRALIVNGNASPVKVREQVLYMCRRRCCVCFALHGDMGVKMGHIVHLDRDHRNCNIENLAFLCQICHGSYDGKSNQIVGYTPDEIRLYRDLLFQWLCQELPY